MEWAGSSVLPASVSYEASRASNRSLFPRATLTGYASQVSENLCYTDAYARQTDATVVEVDPDAHAVLLDRTVFYPGGGGQPADTGQLIGESGGSWRMLRFGWA